MRKEGLEIMLSTTKMHLLLDKTDVSGLSSQNMVAICP